MLGIVRPHELQLLQTWLKVLALVPEKVFRLAKGRIVDDSVENRVCRYEFGA